ncbi:MAG: sugar ABC transporter permease [Limnochordales bacterium]
MGSAMRRRRIWTAYAFMAVPLLFTIVFIYYPMIANLALAFFEYNVIQPPKFVGWDNFKRAFSDPLVANALKNSFKYLLIVPVIQLVSFLMALLVHRRWPGISLFRSLYFFPVITPMIVVSLAWKWIFQSDGILNYVLRAVGLTTRPILFLSNPDIVLYSVMFVTFWTGIGYYMMIYLAGLQGIPEEYIEAAKLDGANSYHLFTKILMPLMRPYILFCSIISTIGALGVFTEVYAVTRGGPGHASETMGILIYKTAFDHLEFGYAAVLSILLTACILAVTLVNLWFQRKGGLEEY